MNPTKEEMKSPLEVDTYTELNPHDGQTPIMASKFTGQRVGHLVHQDLQYSQRYRLREESRSLWTDSKYRGVKEPHQTH